MSDPDLDLRTSKRLWMIAAVTAVGLHLGGAALALANLRGDDDGEGLGTAAAQYAVELASADVPDEQAPPGPGSDETPPVEEKTQQKAEVKDTDLPQAQPTEAEDPDRIVTEDNSKKPKEEDAKLAKVETQAQDPQQASEFTRETKLEDARQSETTKAPNAGIGKDKLALTAKWDKKIIGILEKNKRYPKVSKGKEARVMLTFALNRLGRVIELAVAESSGDAAFDEEALAMVRRSNSELPPPPAELTQDTFTYTVPVIFNKPK